MLDIYAYIPKILLFLWDDDITQMACTVVRSVFSVNGSSRCQVSK